MTPSSIKKVYLLNLSLLKIPAMKNHSTKSIALLLTLIVLALFGRAIYFDFVNLDDTRYVYENDHLKKGLTASGILWTFTTTYAEFWHPLTWLSLLIDYQLYGRWAGGYHLTNVLLHLVNTLLLFILFQKMTESPLKSFILSALFALHPLHVEPVAWISARKDVLSTLFFMLTLLTYVRYTKSPSSWHLLLSLFFYLLGLMGKPMVVTLPFLMMLLDFWPLRRLYPTEPLKDTKKGKKTKAPSSSTPNITLQEGLIRSLKEKIPFFALTAVMSIVAYMAQRKEPIKAFPFMARLANAFISYVTYLVKTAFPFDLAVFYPFPTDISYLKATLCAVIVIAISLFLLFRAKRFPPLFVGWFWYVGTLFPVIGIVQVGKHALADRYTYIPLIGIFLALIYGTPPFWEKRRYSKIVVSVTIIFSLSFLSVLTYRQLSYWQNDFTLFHHALSVTKNNALAHNNLGAAYKEKGNLTEAEARYREALRIEPDNYLYHINLAGVLSDLGEEKEALYHYREGLKLNPRDVRAHNNFGIILAKEGKIEEAMEHFATAIKLDPTYALAYGNMGKALFSLGRTEEAIFHFRKAVNLDAHFLEAHYNLAVSLLSLALSELNTGNYDLNDVKAMVEEGIYHLEETLRLKPDFPQALKHLKNARTLRKELER